jgi:HK97 family phage portal protein
MALWDRVTHALAMIAPPIETDWHERSTLFETSAFGEFEALPIADQVAALRARRAGVNPWRAPSIAQAIGVPAIHRAVTLISNTGGSLSLDAYRKGIRLSDDQRPILIIRPNPLTTPRDFLRDTFYSMAVYGEAWWWIAKRDTDGNPSALYPVNPREIIVEPNERNALRPIIRWGDREMANEDMRQITLMRDVGDLRGYGPLQACKAAVSIAVESQEWAANFYAEGGHFSTLIKYAGDLSSKEDGTGEAETLKAQWTDSPNNVPKVIDENIESVDYTQPNESGAQMLEARDHQNGDAARMFGIPGSLLDYRAGGSNLTYQNLEQEMTKFLRTCLIPNYLTPVEQVMSDLLTRSTIAKFFVDEVNRADIKTRYEVYKLGFESGVLDAETAQKMEGIQPGNLENAPIPLSPPSAIVTALPVQLRSVSTDLRCPNCEKLNVRNFTGSGDFKCARCRHEWTVQDRSLPAPEKMPEPILAQPAQTVEFHEGAIVTNVNVPERQPINMSEVVKTIAMRTVFERDETGRISGMREEPV